MIPDTKKELAENLKRALNIDFLMESLSECIDRWVGEPDMRGEDVSFNLIRRRAEKATTGPWGRFYGSCAVTIDRFFSSSAVTTDCGKTIASICSPNWDHDTEFIAHARVDVVKLLDYIECMTDRHKKEIEFYRRGGRRAANAPVTFNPLEDAFYRKPNETK